MSNCFPVATDVFYLSAFSPKAWKRLQNHCNQRYHICFEWFSNGFISNVLASHRLLHTFSVNFGLHFSVEFLALQNLAHSNPDKIHDSRNDRHRPGDKWKSNLYNVWRSLLIFFQFWIQFQRYHYHNDGKRRSSGLEFYLGLRYRNYRQTSLFNKLADFGQLIYWAIYFWLLPNDYSGRLGSTVKQLVGAQALVFLITDALHGFADCNSKLSV